MSHEKHAVERGDVCPKATVEAESSVQGQENSRSLSPTVTRGLMSRSLLWGRGDLGELLRDPIPGKTLAIRDTLKGELGYQKPVRQLGVTKNRLHTGQPRLSGPDCPSVPHPRFHPAPPRGCLPLQRLRDLVPKRAEPASSPALLLCQPPACRLPGLSDRGEAQGDLPQ